MLSPTRSKSSSMARRVRSRSTSRRHGSNASEPMPYYPRTTLTPEEQDELYESPMPHRIDGTWPSLSTTPNLIHSRSGGQLSIVEDLNDRISAGPSIIMSSMSSMPSLKESPMEKKSGGFKATIRRMFGSKRSRELMEESRKEYHASDPGHLMNAERPPSHHVSAPATSRPRTTLHRNPLGSHTVTQSSDVRNFGGASRDQSLPSLQRRNTLPSITFTEHEAQNATHTLADATDNDDDDDLQQSSRNNSTFSERDRRRSKSVDALAKQFLNEQDESDRQDRDSEIALWRNSFLLTPLPKLNTHDSGKLTREPSRNEVEHVPSLEHIIKPSQSFDFGLSSSTSEPADIEERVNTLEVKMYDFEHAIAKLQGIDLPKHALPTKRMRRKNIQEVYARPSIRSLSTAISERTSVTPGDSPVLGSPIKVVFTPDRNSKATTVRPLTRNGSTPRGSLRLTGTQVETLMAMIQDEKDARQLMELQILDMQREIEQLQFPVYATINYPTPSPESTRGASQKRLHRSPPFRFEKPPSRETSRFSMDESDNESSRDGYEENFRTPRQGQFDFEDSRRSPLIGVVV